MHVRFPVILHGGDYNPEQWPEEVWGEDVALMRQAHVNVATLPVFGWVSLEPEEGRLTFDWLDRVIDRLWAAGVHLCLATGTASTPAWLDQAYPDVLRVNSDGRKLRHGGRHSFCPNSANFRRLSTRLATEMASRYARHPGLVVWHIGNEYGGTCYCDTCGAAFHDWLKRRYGSLDTLNDRWYTRFWGHTYSDWSQIEPPLRTGERSIQALLLDYDRFQSDSLLACFMAERDAVRPFRPEIPITTNFMGAFKPLDYHRWARELDIVSWDSYPPRGASPAEIAFGHALMRGLKEGQPWILMEQTPSQQNWQPYNALKRPGIMRLWSYQALAHGADSVMYFQWRRGRGGCEKFHGAVVEHAGRTDVRVFQEVAALGAELESLGARTLGARFRARVAILFDWETWWAVEYSSGPSVDLTYVRWIMDYFAALHRAGIPADIVSPEADLSAYTLVIAPLLYMVKGDLVGRLEQHVADGATFLATCFSGIVDANDRVFDGGYPGPLRALLGLWVEETDVLTPLDVNRIVFDTSFGRLAGAYPARLLCDRVRTTGASTLAVFGDDFYAGEPALTVHAVGRGQAYYVATGLDGDVLTDLLAEICVRSGISAPLGPQPAGIEVTERQGEDGPLFFVLNHAVEPRTLTIPSGSYRDLIMGTPVTNGATLPRYAVMILSPA
ncbi:MAG: beta-galactosidase [Capsulimonadaceae bacterium]